MTGDGSRGSLAGTRRDTVFALAAVTLWAAALVAWSYAARDRLPAAATAASGWPSEIARRAPPLARYDSGWYRKVVEEGYSRVPPGPGETSEHAFFPLYPAIVGGLARATSADAFAVGIFVSLACLAGAAVLFVAEGRRRSSEREGRHALIFLLLFPTAFFLASMYAEALFLLLALLAFASLARNRFAAAAAFGFLAGWTRLPALALVLPLGLTAAGLAAGGRPALRPEERALRTRRFVRAALVAIAPAAGVFLWIWAIGLWTGEPGIYFRIQRAWNRGSSPLAGLAQWSLALPMRLARGDARTHPGFVVDYAVALLFVVLAVFQARRRRWSDASWTAGALLLPAATGIAASVPRYLVVVYPAFFALEEVFRGRPAGRWIWWIVSAALLLAGTAAFVNWRWVA